MGSFNVAVHRDSVIHVPAYSNHGDLFYNPMKLFRNISQDLRRKGLKGKESLGIIVFLTGTILFVAGCERNVPITSFDFSYAPQYKIEGDFYPVNLGKSVLRIDHTFTIADSMNVEQAHIRDAQAKLLDASEQVLSTLSWQDSAASYPYFNTTERDRRLSLDSLASLLDTMYYGGYKLDNLSFSLDSGKTYTLQVKINGEDFSTTFTPYPAVNFLPFDIDSVVMKQNQQWGGTYPEIYTTMRSDTAKIAWPEDPDASFYTVYLRQLHASIEIGPSLFTFPGPALSFGVLPGEYEVVIGAMSHRFYRHYYLNDFPPNHDARNFFGGKALGYAGTINERYLHLKIVGVSGQ